MTSETCAHLDRSGSTKCATMACIHVVPLLGQEQMNTSVGSVFRFVSVVNGGATGSRGKSAAAVARTRAARIDACIFELSRWGALCVLWCGCWCSRGSAWRSAHARMLNVALSWQRLVPRMVRFLHSRDLLGLASCKTLGSLVCYLIR